MKITINDIKTAVKDSEFYYYGIRVDSGIKYNIGDTASNSHQISQEPEFDDNGEVMYPYREDGLYAGFYDEGELNGTSAIEFYADNDRSIQEALSIIDNYEGSYLHILGGDRVEEGNNRREIIIREAKVLCSYER